MEPKPPDVRRNSIGRGRLLALVAAAGWSAILLFGLAYAAFVNYMGELGCAASAGDSNYGRRDWSVLPPGPTCTYTSDLNGFDRVDGPTPIMFIWIVGLVLGAAVCLALLSRSRRA